MDSDKAEISDRVEAQKEVEINVARKAWRGVMLGAVGSLAFFLSTLGNLGKTYKAHGNPLKQLETHDMILFSLPILVISYFLVESANGDEAGDVA